MCSDLDGLLKNVAEDIYINHRADFGVLVRVGHFARGPVIVIAEVLEIGADFIGYLEGVQTLIQGEEAAIVGGDVQAGIAFVNGAEQAPEVEPDGLRVVRVAVLEGVLAARKSGSKAVSLKLSARPEAIRPAQCWSLGCQSPTRSGRLKARTCWRMTSGWKSGLDSSAICLAAAYAATGKNQAYSCLEPSGAGLL